MASIPLGSNYNDRIDSTSSILVGETPLSTGSTELSRPTYATFDHGTLSGLEDDDHTQYALLDGRDGDTLQIDDVVEQTAGHGVEIEGIILKDSEVNIPVTKGIIFGDGDTKIYESSDDVLRIGIGGNLDRYEIAANYIKSDVATSWGLLTETATSTNPTIVPYYNDANTGIGWHSSNVLSLIAGGTEALRMSSSAILPQLSMNFSDGKTINFGNDNDFRIWHDGTNNIIRSYNNGADFYIQGNDTGGALKNIIYGSPDSSVNLFYDGSKRLETTSSGIAVTGTMHLGDNDEILLGTDSDFRMWHDGTNHYLRSYKHGADIYIQGENASGINRQIMIGDPDGSVKLYYAGVTRFETDSGGIKVTGRVDITDNIKIDKSSGDAYLELNSGAGTYRVNRAKTNDDIRWQWGANSTSESGSNTGSDFSIWNYDDAGGYLGNPLHITRSSGNIKFGANILAPSMSGTGAGEDDRVLFWDSGNGKITQGAKSAVGISEVSDDTTPALGGDLTVGTNGIEVNNSFSSDHTASGLIISGQVDVNGYGIGAALGVASDGHWETCDADNTGDFPCSGLALESGTGSGKQILIYGTMRNDSWSFTTGSPVYVSTTDGNLSTTAPSGSSDQVQRVGVALSADVILFQPSLDVIDLA